MDSNQSKEALQDEALEGTIIGREVALEAGRGGDRYDSYVLPSHASNARADRELRCEISGYDALNISKSQG
jgi:hypothetical protein